ncbi:unnamed protein product [Orchesella dallaii]|uniref:Uncharacterized protein n=1 Tax=Orchesella dallaii TaxID=48710 RepID=A0ABP1QSS6_9HEXA
MPFASHATQTYKKVFDILSLSYKQIPSSRNATYNVSQGTARLEEFYNNNILLILIPSHQNQNGLRV